MWQVWYANWYYSERVSNLKQVSIYRRTPNPLLPDCSSVRISYYVCSVSYELRLIAIPISFWFTCEFMCFTVVCVGAMYYFTCKSIMYEIANVTLVTFRIFFNILVNDPFNYSEDQRFLERIDRDNLLEQVNNQKERKWYDWLSHV